MNRSRWIAGVLSVLVLLLSITAVSAFPYQVQWGDTLSQLAVRFGVSTNAIVDANTKITNPNLIFAGDTIEIPPEGSIGGRPEDGRHVVKRGDTLFAIARRYSTTVDELLALNPLIRNKNLIYPGQVILLPGGRGGEPNPPPPSSISFGVGGQIVNFNSANRMKDTGMTWAKVQVRWRPGDSPSLVVGDIQAARDSGMKILLSITGADSYPAAGSIDFDSYVSFVSGVAALDPDAIEIWNEMNLDREWPKGEINPSTYVNSLLRPSYEAIKAVDRDILVISGALAPTGFDDNLTAWADDRYLRGMASANAASYMDCLGVHHNAGATSPSARSGHPAATQHHSWYYLPTIELYDSIMGNQRPLCVTELGYLTSEGLPPLPANFSWASDNTLGEQAAWLGEAIQLSKNRGDVSLIIVFNIDFTKYDNSDPQAGYAIIRQDGSCPACEPIKQAIN